MKTLTISIEDELFARASRVAEERGVSLETLVTRYLEELMSQMTPEEVIRELKKLVGGGKLELGRPHVDSRGDP